MRDDAELRALITEIIRQVLEENSPLFSSQHSQTLLVLGAAKTGLFVSCDTALSISKGFQTDLYLDESSQTQSCKRVLLEELPSSTTVIHQSEGLVRALEAGRYQRLIHLLPQRETLAAAARGVSGPPDGEILKAALKNGVPCYLAGGDLMEESLPVTAPAPMRQGYKSYRALLDEDIERLIAFGAQVRECPREMFQVLTSQVHKAFSHNLSFQSDDPPSSRTFVTKADLQDARRKGVNELQLAQNSVLTDAAKEYAREVGMKLTL